MSSARFYQINQPIANDSILPILINLLDLNGEHHNTEVYMSIAGGLFAKFVVVSINVLNP